MSSAAVETRPYVGLRYFEERDAHLFYGRDEHVGELLSKLAANRFVAVIGSSGGGKSSLVRAGLLPELRSGMIPKAGPRWKAIEFKPGSDPLGELSKAITASLGGESVRNVVEEGPLGIARAVADAKLDGRTNVLIIADQFEEIFRFQREESSQGRVAAAEEQCQSLVRRLLDAAAQAELPIYILLVMRSDYLGECAQFPELPERMSENLYLVPRLRRDQLQEAITAPLGGAIEPAVVQRLLGEVGSDPDQLPRLQHLLGRMWDLAHGGRLTKDHYKEAGGWERGLEKHLEEVYSGLSEAQQLVCQRVFQQLSELDKGRAVRRRAEIGELQRVCGEEASAVVETFRREGFLSPQSSPVDITHECVLRGWPKAREWLAGEIVDRDFYMELIKRKGRKGRLLGSDLREVSRLLKAGRFSANWAARYGTAEDFVSVKQYVHISRLKRKAVQLGVLGLAIAAFVLGVYAVWSSGRGARESKAIELAANAEESLSEDPERSILLGMYAVNSTWRLHEPPPPAVEDVLHRAILSSQVRLTLRGHTRLVTGVAYGAGGRRLATASGDKTVKVWDAVSGQELLTLLGHTGSVYGVAYSPDGKRLATVSGDKTLKVWDAVSGQELLTLRGHTDAVYGVAYSPDGKRLATASWDGTAKVWDAVSGQELLTLRGHTGYVDGVAYSPDGKRLATASEDETVKVWDAVSGQELLTLRGHTDAVNGVAYSPDGKGLATASEDKTVKVWDAVSGQELLTLRGHTDPVYGVAYSPDGGRLATASEDKTVKVWDAGSGQELLTLRGHTDPVYGVAYSRPDGGRLATASVDGKAKVWDAASGQELLTLRGHTSIVNGVAYSPDGGRLATASADKTVKVWDAVSGQELLTLRGNAGYVYGVAYGPDGKRLATASADGTAKVWDAVSGQELLTLRGHKDRVNGVAYSPDGKRLATVSGDKTLKVWDAVSGQELLTLRGHTDPIYGVAYSPDGKRLATASWDKTVKVWDAVSGQEVLTLGGHTGHVNGVAYSPDGKRLATASEDKTVKVWDAVSGQELLTLLGHADPVNGVAYSRDGKRLATGSVDKTVKVWDAASGRKLLTLLGHTDQVSEVSYSPDGKRLATASADRTVEIYALDIRELLDLARSRVTRTPVSLTPEECKRYFQPETCPPLP